MTKVGEEDLTENPTTQTAGETGTNPLPNAGLASSGAASKPRSRTPPPRVPLNPSSGVPPPGIDLNRVPGTNTADIKKAEGMSTLDSQEVKNSEERLGNQLLSLILGAQVVSDLNEEARGGTAIIVASTLSIIGQGTRDDGSCAWVTIETSKGPNEQKAKYRELEAKEAELQKLKITAEVRSTTELEEKITKLEEELRTKEIPNTTRWRKRSRNRWLKEGEAPSKYFFSQLKSKHKRESFKSLQLDIGEVVTAENRIMEEIEKFYS
ncbi:hypothetical protein R1sor_025616 [Riccia sorocarpa]|uniref:Uncharacterized protein n=1 Tax=Riccia sorocarpa TaxID=122646 RepID=A0ABD3G9L9_9MARC